MLLQNEQRQFITQRIDPKIIMANTILQLSSMELNQSIENELLENPALDILEDTSCAGDCVDPATCSFCPLRKIKEAQAENETESLDSGDHESEYESAFGLNFGEIEEDFDPVGNLESEVTLHDHLKGLLRTAVPPEDYWIGEYLINSLNERGWLGESLEIIAMELDIPVSEVCRLLTVIQTFDPPGVGAQNLQECLLLQLRYLKEEAGQEPERILGLAERMVRDYFDHLAHHRYSKLARALSLSQDETRQVFDYIGKRLNPYPASQFRPPWTSRPTNNKASVRPDVVIRRTELGYEVDIVENDVSSLSINPLWRDDYNKIKGGQGNYTDEFKKSIFEYVERAELFIRNINQRRHSLRQITRSIIDCQTGFLETGSRQFLRPLTRTRIARLLGIHESTVSRATANKYVQLPNQEVVSFNIFFNSSLSIKEAIEEIIQNEDPSNPLSDQQIVQHLEEKGVQVARRTVVKYRESQKILSSTRRRR